MDRWHGLTLQDIREIEDKTREELDRVSFVECLQMATLLMNYFLLQQRNEGTVRGMKADAD